MIKVTYIVRSNREMLNLIKRKLFLGSLIVYIFILRNVQFRTRVFPLYATMLRLSREVRCCFSCFSPYYVFCLFFPYRFLNCYKTQQWSVFCSTEHTIFYLVNRELFCAALQTTEKTNNLCRFHTFFLLPFHNKKQGIFLYYFARLIVYQVRFQFVFFTDCGRADALFIVYFPS